MPFGVGGFRRPGPIDPRGDPDRRPPPTPTLRQMQMQAALRAAAPRGGGRGWQAGGEVGGFGGGSYPTGSYSGGTGLLEEMRGCPSPKEHIQLANNDWILAGDLKVGDEVMTSKDPQKVTRVLRIENSPRCEVFFAEGDSIVSSYTHPYFVENKGFVEVIDLEKGDTIGDLVVKNKKSFPNGPVISLSVDEAETYMLRGGTKDSPVPALSHNKTPIPDWYYGQQQAAAAAAAAQRAAAAAARRANQARRLGSRGPGGWQAGGAVAPTNLGPLPGSPGAQPGYISPYPSGGGPFESTYGIIPQIPSPRQMQMQAAHRGRGPGGWQGGGAVDVVEALMAERDRLQQQLQMADEVTAQEILMQIMEINKELEMEARNFGMAGGGVASLMGDVRGYQGGGAPRRTGALHGSITGDPSSGRWTEHFPVGSFWPNVPRLSSIYSGWGTVDKRVPGQTITSFNNQNLPYPNRPPGGG